VSEFIVLFDILDCIECVRWGLLLSMIAASVCHAASLGFAVQKWLNGSRSCSRCRFLAAHGTLDLTAVPTPAPLTEGGGSDSWRLTEHWIWRQSRPPPRSPREGDLILGGPRNIGFNGSPDPLPAPLTEERGSDAAVAKLLCPLINYRNGWNSSRSSLWKLFAKIG